MLPTDAQRVAAVDTTATVQDARVQALARDGGSGAAAKGPAAADAPDAGAPPAINLFVFHVADESHAESRNICAEPVTGLWRRTRLVGSLAEMVSVVRATAAQFSIANLGILAHGDSGGRFQIGAESVNVATLNPALPAGWRRAAATATTVRSQMRTLDGVLASNATVYIYGCVSGADKEGSAFLKVLSTLMPGRRIVAFNVINTVQPRVIRKVDGKPCFDPLVWATSVKSGFAVTTGGRATSANEATDTAPQAKIAKDGAIVKWPADENAKRHDASLKDIDMKNFVPGDQRQ